MGEDSPTLGFRKVWSVDKTIGDSKAFDFGYFKESILDKKISDDGLQFGYENFYMQCLNCIIIFIIIL